MTILELLQNFLYEKEEQLNRAQMPNTLLT